MTYAIKDVITTLKHTREASGLSQRALSTLTGVPQSHISKIENGSADIRLSSLIELSRALDLELRLVPRKAVAAVDSIVSGLGRDDVAQRPAYQLDDDDDHDDDGHHHRDDQRRQRSDG